MVKRFKRNIENFICEKCDKKVMGNGYTNHCPYCLWSKHVDINPGDRMSECGGAMWPAAVDQKAGEWRILHKCLTCRYEKWNKISEDDDVEKIIQLVLNLNK